MQTLYELGCCCCSDQEVLLYIFRFLDFRFLDFYITRVIKSIKQKARGTDAPPACIGLLTPRLIIKILILDINLGLLLQAPISLIS